MSADQFAKLKKRFTKHLKKPEQSPASLFLQMGEHDKPMSRYACEGDFAVTVDPEGDAWVFLGPHASLSRMVGLTKPGTEMTKT